MKRSSLAVVVATVILIFGCTKNRNIIDVGEGPGDIGKIDYRLIDVLQDGKDIPKTHSDLSRMTMDIQAGRARGKWAYIPLYKCWAPKVREGFASVDCTSENGSDVTIASSDNVREILLGLQADGKRADIKGKIIGLSVDAPFLLVIDTNAKKKSN
jgi:hypothetical protein